MDKTSLDERRAAVNPPNWIDFVESLTPEQEAALDDILAGKQVVDAILADLGQMPEGGEK